MKQPRPARTKILVAAILAGVCLAGGIYADRRINDVALQDASDELLLLMSLRRSALEGYFDTVRAELTLWSLSEQLRAALPRLREGWNALPENTGEYLQTGYIEKNPHLRAERRKLAELGDGTAYDAAHRDIHTLARTFVSQRGYYDFFLIGPDGNVLYSVEKESDFATNLAHGQMSSTGLADVYRRAAAQSAPGEVVYSDFERYAPSDLAPALFGAIPIFATGGALKGVLAVQVPTQRIQRIMQFSEGMGNTGETYLVGSDYLMRSDSRFSDTSTILETRVESPAVKRALGKQTGVTFTNDYRGVPVLSAFGIFSFDGFDWAVMAEIDREEIFEEVASRRLRIPVVGLAVYGLSLLSLWYLDTGDWSPADFDGLDIGDDGSAA